MPNLDPIIAATPSALRQNDIWLNNSGVPLDQPVYSGNAPSIGTAIPVLGISLLSHLDDQYMTFTYRTQYSPGYHPDYVMGHQLNTQHLKRNWTNPELRALLGLVSPISGLSYQMNPVFGAANQYLINNTPPYRTDFATNPQTLYQNSNNYNLPEIMPACATMVNDGTTLILNLNNPVLNLADDEGDPITVFPNSLFGIRGVSLPGSNLNNHNTISVTNNGATIQYLPPAGFIGRAQFGFYLYDGKEKGALKIVTIEVTPGSFVLPFGSNMVINGDFEDGTEVRQRLAPNAATLPNLTKPYTGLESRYQEGFMLGAHFSGAHPYSMHSNILGGTYVRETFKSCGQISTFYGVFGKGNNSIASLNFLPAQSGVNDRFQSLRNLHNYSTLYNETQYCKSYLFECDIAFPSAIWIVGDIAHYNLDFTTAPTVAISNPTLPNNPPISNTIYSIPLNIPVTTVNSQAMGGNNWQHVSIPFKYCSLIPARYINIVPINQVINPAVESIDNISIKEQLQATVTTSPATISPCANTAFTYSVEVCNTSGSTLNNILVQSILPAGYTAVAGSAYTINGQEININPFNLAVGTVTNPVCTTFVVNAIAGTTNGNIFTTALPACITNDCKSQISITLCGALSITKTATPSSTYSGAPVDFAIEICNNTGTTQTVDVTDQLPSDFTPNPSGQNLLLPGTQLILPASPPACTTLHIYGYFSTIGPNTDPIHINQVDLDQGSTGTHLESSVGVNVMRGCPFSLSGTGGCNVSDDVYLSLNGHAPVPNVHSMDFDIVYPSFLDPPTQANFMISEFGQFHNLIDWGATTITAASPWALQPAGYNFVTIHVEFGPNPPNPSVQSIYGSPTFFTSILKIKFTVNGSGIPAGQNVFTTFVNNNTLGLYKVSAKDLGGNEIISGGAWTAANYLTLQNCPNVTPLDASFSISQIPCDSLGGVTVTANYNAPGIIHNWTWGDGRTTPINGASTYTYNYLEPLCNTTGFNFCTAPFNLPAIAPAAPGTYTITHTVINMQTGVSSTATQQVVVYPACCTAATIIPAGATATGLGLSSVSGTVEIRGDFTIDQSFTFINAMVTVEPGAKITVLGGADFYVRNTTIESCSNMWRGILVNNTSKIFVYKNSVIKDAETGITAMNGTSFDLRDSRVTDCVRSVYIPQQSGANNVQGYVNNCKFGLYAAAFKPDYAGQPTHGAIPRACMEFYDAVLTIGDKDANEFRNSNWGIYAHRTYLTVQNCKFRNMHLGGYGGATHNGSAIVAESSSAGTASQLIVYPLDDNSITIDSCVYGIYTEWATAKIGYISTRHISGSAIFNLRCNAANLTTDIRYCDLEADKNGIQWQNNEKGNMSAIENAIKVSVGTNAAGIKILSTTTNFGNYTVQGNVINAVGGSGITANAAKNVNVTGNHVKLSGNTKYGISLTNCDSSVVGCNAVSGRYPAVTYNNYGFYNSLNHESYFSCNFTDSAKTGVYFGGSNIGTKFRGNEMKKHNIGLYLDNTAVIDTQTHAGNMWTGVYNSTYGAWNENWLISGNLQKSLFVVDPALGATYNPSIPLVGLGGIPNDNGWFHFNTGNTFSCEGLFLCVDEHQERGEGSGDLKEAIALDSILTSDYIPESKMIAQMDLFEELKEDSILKNSNVVFGNFVNDKENESIGYLYKANEKLKELDNFSAQQQTTLSFADSMISVYLNEIKTLDSIAANDSTVNNIQARGNLINSLSAQLAIREMIINQVQTTNVAKITDAMGFNSLASTTGLPDDNMKFINGINTLYLLHGKDTLNAYYQQILSVAEQCPFAGGKAVYTARSFVSLFNDSVTYDDENNCLQQGYYRLSVTDSSVMQTTDVALIPNPADETTQIILNKKYEGVCRVNITDAYSKTVYVNEFDCKQQQLSISTKGFSQGVYHVRISINNNIIKTAKLIIAR